MSCGRLLIALQLQLLLLLLLSVAGRGDAAAAAAAAISESSCKLSEHRCASSGICIAQDKFCDGENDCEDKSDEPVYCTR